MVEREREIVPTRVSFFIYISNPCFVLEIVSTGRQLVVVTEKLALISFRGLAIFVHFKGLSYLKKNSKVLTLHVQNKRSYTVKNSLIAFLVFDVRDSVI